jgi:hypothetical protein
LGIQKHIRSKEQASFGSFFNTRKGIPRLPERTGKEPAVFVLGSYFIFSPKTLRTPVAYDNRVILNILENPGYYELKEPTLIPKRGFDAISNTCPTTLVISSALAACMHGQDM